MNGQEKELTSSIRRFLIPDLISIVAEYWIDEIHGKEKRNVRLWDMGPSPSRVVTTCYGLVGLFPLGLKIFNEKSGFWDMVSNQTFEPNCLCVDDHTMEEVFVANVCSPLRLRVFDTRIRSLKRSLVLDKGIVDVRSMATHQCYIVLLSYETYPNTVYLVDKNTGARVRNFALHTFTLDIECTDGMLFTSERDLTIDVYDIESGSHMKTLKTNVPVECFTLLNEYQMLLRLHNGQGVILRNEKTQAEVVVCLNRAGVRCAKSNTHKGFVLVLPSENTIRVFS